MNPGLEPRRKGTRVSLPPETSLFGDVLSVVISEAASGEEVLRILSLEFGHHSVGHEGHQLQRVHGGNRWLRPVHISRVKEACRSKETHGPTQRSVAPEAGIDVRDCRFDDAQRLPVHGTCITRCRHTGNAVLNSDMDCNLMQAALRMCLEVAETFHDPGHHKAGGEHERSISLQVVQGTDDDGASVVDGSKLKQQLVVCSSVT
mmetsp:Transcript_57565/g.135469  ORF Transcript_57565/g.135469 Transcript_57565/m.135469 type:complete len:204 (-) Transcript_57565:1452-2063(-)